MDHSREAFVCLVGSHGDTLEFLQFAEKVLDQVAPFIEVSVERRRRSAPRMRRDNDLSATLVEIGDDVIGVKGFVGDQSAEVEAVDERGDTDRIETMTWQENKAHQIAERVGEGEDFGRHAALGTAYGLILSPPFAPCPWRWTLTMVALTMAYSMSGSFEQASKSL
jgi:hypothetical protein